MENKRLLLIIIILILGGFLFVTLSANKQKTTVHTNATTTQKNNTTDPTASENYSNGIQLTITEPTNNKTVTTSTIIITGKTSAGAEIFINDIELRADGTGNFATQITLDEGENTIIVVANDAEGNSAEQEITVTYTPSSSE